MITNETYKDRIALDEEQQNKHLNMLKGMLGEYMAIYTKASHSKKHQDKMNKVMDSYIKTKNLNLGLTICMELIKYDPNDQTKEKNIHIVISRIVHNAIKEVEYNMNYEMLDKAFEILTSVDEEYQEQYKDCYSKLACIYKNEHEYDKAVELYTILSNLEVTKPAKTVVSALYLLTYSYTQNNINHLSEYDIETIKDALDDYSSCGGVDYYDVRGTVEALEKNLKNSSIQTTCTQQHTSTHLNQ